MTQVNSEPSTVRNQNRQKKRGLSISTGVAYTNFYVNGGTKPFSPAVPSNGNWQHWRSGSSEKASVFGFSSKHIGLDIDWKIMFLCVCWYLSSVVSSNLTKNILRLFPFPISLTEIQFLITSFFCLLTSTAVYRRRDLAAQFPVGTFPAKLTSQSSQSLTFWQIFAPSSKIWAQTVPMGMFQFVGHISSHKATSLINVSMVHTVKALSPIMTVLCYRILFHVQYPSVTYLTLLPLMVGIILTTLWKPSKRGHESNSTVGSDYFKGLFFAFVSMLIFVSQNIFAKKILTVKSMLLPTETEASKTRAKDEKIDKLTILFYCSIVGFIFTLPIYISAELFSHGEFSWRHLSKPVVFLMFLHGLSHFLQSLLAFHILGLISPVSYSIANIFKRIFIIFAALLWEAQPLGAIQGFGLVLTMIGLYCYDRWGTKKH